MDIHKPKPWHGLRDFLKEYAIIVVGVLTALAAESGVEWLHWRHEAHVAREAMTYDMRRTLGWSAATDAEAPCVLARLQALSDVLDEAARTRKLPPLGSFPPPQSHSWIMRGWSALVAGQTLAHLPNREQTLLAAIANRLDYLYRERDQSILDWSELQTMAGMGRPVSDAELAGLNAALGRAATHQSNLQGGARQTPTLILQTGLLSRADVQRAWDEGLAAGKASRVCKPLPEPQPRRAWLPYMFRMQPIRPGEEKADTLGVAGAVTTER